VNVPMQLSTLLCITVRTRSLPDDFAAKVARIKSIRPVKAVLSAL
jgi:hypothetical protein